MSKVSNVRTAGNSQAKTANTANVASKTTVEATTNVAHTAPKSGTKIPAAWQFSDYASRLRQSKLNEFASLPKLLSTAPNEVAAVIRREEAPNKEDIDQVFELESSDGEEQIKKSLEGVEVISNPVDLRKKRTAAFLENFDPSKIVPRLFKPIDSRNDEADKIVAEYKSKIKRLIRPNANRKVRKCCLCAYFTALYELIKLAADDKDNEHALKWLELATNIEQSLGTLNFEELVQASEQLVSRTLCDVRARLLPAGGATQDFSGLSKATKALRDAVDFSIILITAPAMSAHREGTMDLALLVSRCLNDGIDKVSEFIRLETMAQRHTLAEKCLAFVHYHSVDLQAIYSLDTRDNILPRLIKTPQYLRLVTAAQHGADTIFAEDVGAGTITTDFVQQVMHYVAHCILRYVHMSYRQISCPFDADPYVLCVILSWLAALRSAVKRTNASVPNLRQLVSEFTFDKEAFRDICKKLMGPAAIGNVLEVYQIKLADIRVMTDKELLVMQDDSIWKAQVYYMESTLPFTKQCGVKLDYVSFQSKEWSGLKLFTIPGEKAQQKLTTVRNIFKSLKKNMTYKQVAGALYSMYESELVKEWRSIYAEIPDLEIESTVLLSTVSSFSDLSTSQEIAVEETPLKEADTPEDVNADASTSTGDPTIIETLNTALDTLKTPRRTTLLDSEFERQTPPVSPQGSLTSASTLASFKTVIEGEVEELQPIPIYFGRGGLTRNKIFARKKVGKHSVKSEVEIAQILLKANLAKEIESNVVRACNRVLQNNAERVVWLDGNYVFESRLNGPVADPDRHRFEAVEDEFHRIVRRNKNIIDRIIRWTDPRRIEAVKAGDEGSYFNGDVINARQAASNAANSANGNRVQFEKLTPNILRHYDVYDNTSLYTIAWAIFTMLQDLEQQELAPRLGNAHAGCVLFANMNAVGADIDVQVQHFNNAVNVGRLHMENRHLTDQDYACMQAISAGTQAVRAPAGVGLMHVGEALQTPRVDWFVTHSGDRAELPVRRNIAARDMLAFIIKLSNLRNEKDYCARGWAEASALLSGKVYAIDGEDGIKSRFICATLETDGITLHKPRDISPLYKWLGMLNKREAFKKFNEDYQQLVGLQCHEITMCGALWGAIMAQSYSMVFQAQCLLSRHINDCFRVGGNECVAAPYIRNMIEDIVDDMSLISRHAAGMPGQHTGLAINPLYYPQRAWNNRFGDHDPIDDFPVDHYNLMGANKNPSLLHPFCLAFLNLRWPSLTGMMAPVQEANFVNEFRRGIQPALREWGIWEGDEVQPRAFANRRPYIKSNYPMHALNFMAQHCNRERAFDVQCHGVAGDAVIFRHDLELEIDEIEYFEELQVYNPLCLNTWDWEMRMCKLHYVPAAELDPIEVQILLQEKIRSIYAGTHLPDIYLNPILRYDANELEAQMAAMFGENVARDRVPVPAAVARAPTVAELEAKLDEVPDELPKNDGGEAS